MYPIVFRMEPKALWAYHRCMRRALFSLLILLTAFRGMVGDAMAYEMRLGGMGQHSVISANAADLVAPRAESSESVNHLSSEKHAATPCHGATDDTPTIAASHDCNACQVCHSPALQRSNLPISLMQTPAAYASREDRSWQSADRAPLQKPPVS
jgi:hypothetical protein